MVLTLLLGVMGCGAYDESDSFSWTYDVTAEGAIDVQPGSTLVAAWTATSTGMPLHTVVFRVGMDLDLRSTDTFVTVAVEVRAAQSESPWTSDSLVLRLPKPIGQRHVTLSAATGPRACESAACLDHFEVRLVREDGDLSSVVAVDWGAALLLEGAVEGAKLVAPSSVELVEVEP